MLASLHEPIGKSLGFHYKHSTSRKMDSRHWQRSQMAQPSVYFTIYSRLFACCERLGVYSRTTNAINYRDFYSDGCGSSFWHHSRTFARRVAVFTLRTITAARKTLRHRGKTNIKEKGSRTTRPNSITEVATQPRDKREIDMIYVVSYLLNPKRDISNLLTELQNPVTGWCHYLDDTWLISTKETAKQIYERMGKHLTVKDRLLIMQIKPYSEYYGQLPKEAWDWIQKQRDY